MDSPLPTAPSTPQPVSNPSKSDLAAVAATVSVVGVLMAVLITWLVLRLRRVSQQQPIPISVRRRPIHIHSYVVRPSFAPSEASSTFGFIRKSLRLSHRHRDCTSWDFADPDPFAHPKEAPFDSPLPSPTSPKHHRPPPLVYIPRAHRTKDEPSPRTPTTPVAPFVEPPPPAYVPHRLSLPS